VQPCPNWAIHRSPGQRPGKDKTHVLNAESVLQPIASQIIEVLVAFGCLASSAQSTTPFSHKPRAVVDVRKLTPPQAAAVSSLHSSAALGYDEMAFQAMILQFFRADSNFNSRLFKHEKIYFGIRCVF
jgi:hypothetical protein